MSGPLEAIGSRNAYVVTLKLWPKVDIFEEEYGGYYHWQQ